jgi:drug/metabolite transporter (DMT)-like permease
MENKNLALVLLFVFLTTVCNTIDSLLLKSIVNRLNISVTRLNQMLGFVLKLLSQKLLYLVFLINCIALLFWLYVLANAELNFAFSLASMHYIFIAFASRHILKEKVSPLRFIGTVLVVLGIVIVSLS